MQDFAQWLVTSETVREAYGVIFVVGLIVLPLVGLSIWYHTNIGRTEGGRALMKDQNSAKYRPDPIRKYTNPVGLFRGAGELHKGIMSGAYGDQAKQMQMTVYKFCAIWLVVVALDLALPFVLAWVAGV